MSKQSIRILFAVLLLTHHGISGATDCNRLNDFAVRNRIFIPGDDAGRVVIGKGRVQFYPAPDYFCKMKGIFIIKGQTVDSYTEYDGFTSVVYLSDKQAKPIIRWVRSDRLKPNNLGFAPLQK